MIYRKPIADIFISCILPLFVIGFFSFSASAQTARQKISINKGWKFFKGEPNDAKGIFYDIRPKVTNTNDNVIADARANQSNVAVSDSGLKKWILPSANDFIKDISKHYQRPGGNPGVNVSFVQSNFDDSKWEQINLPHDWAIKRPFMKVIMLLSEEAWVVCQFKELGGTERN